MGRPENKNRLNELEQVLRTFSRIFSPVLLILILCTSGYIYLNYFQLRNRLFENEASLIDSLGSALRDEVVGVQSALLDVAAQTELGILLNGETRFLPRVTQRIVDTVIDQSSISFLSLVRADGTEIVRVQPVNRMMVVMPESSLGSFADQEFFHQVSRLPFGTIQVMAPVPASSPDDNSTTDSWLEIGTGVRGPAGNPVGVLIAGYSSAVMDDYLLHQGVDHEGHLWLQQSDGQVVTSEPQDFEANSAVAAEQFPEDIPVQIAGLFVPGEILQSGRVELNGGYVAYNSLCIAIGCEATSGSTPDVTSNDTLNAPHWILATYFSPAQLGVASLLKNQADEWHPVGTLLVFFLISAGIVTWIFSLTLTRLRNREEQIVQDSELHEAFFERNPSIMFVKDLNGVFFLANERCRQLAGDPGQQLTGTDRTAVFPAEAAQAMREQDQQVIARGEPMEFFTSWKRKDGLHYYTTLRFPMYHKDGELYAVGGIANDITGQVIARKALKENEALLRAVLESAPEATLITDSAGIISLVNKQAELVFEAPRAELEGKSINTLLPAVRTDEILALTEGQNSEWGASRKQVTALRTNERSFPAELSLSPVKFSSGNLMICLVHDITERTILEARMRQSQKLEAIGKLTGGMAHDFNNLLGIIMGNIDLAARKINDEEAVRKRLEAARGAAERGAELTKRMLAVARRQPLQPEPTSVNDVIAEVAELLPRTLGKDIEVKLDLGAQVGAVLIDVSGMENVLINLAINASDAMPNGGVFSITTKEELLDYNHYLVRQRLVPEGTYVHIIAADTGIGMSRETLSHAFEPFFSTKDKGKGNGLGLSMAYGFIKQSNGHIYLYSEEGKGTTADIYLPVVNQPAHDRPTTSEAFDFNKTQFSDKTVLVVDDEPGLLDVAINYLQDMGFSVLASTNGMEALQRLSDHPEVDLLITDVVMPGNMNGVALAAQARKNFPGIKVVYVSGFPSGVIEDKSGIKMDAPLLNKPYNRSSLATTVARVLN